MELSLQFADAHFDLHSLSHPSSSKGRQRLASGSFSPQVFTMDAFPSKRHHINAQSNTLFHVAYREHFVQKVLRPFDHFCDRNGLCSRFEYQVRGKFRRDMVARSELVDTGYSDAIQPSFEPQPMSRIRGFLFYAVTAFTAIFLIVPMLLQHPFVLLFDRYRRKTQFYIAKLWAFLTVVPFLKIEYKGLENLPSADTPAVYVSNHQSFLDIYTLLTIGRSFKFISKTSIFLYPIIGWAMFLLGVIPLKRMDTRSQMDCLKQCMALINKGSSVFFFPEGTRSKDGILGAFKKGAFSVAMKTGVAVVPITLVGTGKIMPAGKEGTVNEGSVKVIVHPPVVGSDAGALCNQVRNVIAEELANAG